MNLSRVISTSSSVLANLSPWIGSETSASCAWIASHSLALKVRTAASRSRNASWMFWSALLSAASIRADASERSFSSSAIRRSSAVRSMLMIFLRLSWLSPLIGHLVLFPTVKDGTQNGQAQPKNKIFSKIFFGRKLKTRAPRDPSATVIVTSYANSRLRRTGGTHTRQAPNGIRAGMYVPHPDFCYLSPLPDTHESVRIDLPAESVWPTGDTKAPAASNAPRG